MELSGQFLPICIPSPQILDAGSTKLLLFFFKTYSKYSLSYLGIISSCRWTSCCATSLPHSPCFPSPTTCSLGHLACHSLPFQHLPPCPANPPPSRSLFFVKPPSGCIENHLLYIERPSSVRSQIQTDVPPGAFTDRLSLSLSLLATREGRGLKCQTVGGGKPVKERRSSARALPQACSV